MYHLCTVGSNTKYETLVLLGRGGTLPYFHVRSLRNDQLHLIGVDLNPHPIGRVR
jgi:hypothetical protein